MKRKYFLSIIALFIWIGFVGAISFMEAWLKFRAEGVTLSIGLNIGKIVFQALNKMEWAFFIIILSELMLRKAKITTTRILYLFIPAVALILQSFWLLPVLNERADLLIQGQSLASSNIHFVYVAVEIVKIVCLFVFGISLLKEKI